MLDVDNDLHAENTKCSQKEYLEWEMTRHAITPRNELIYLPEQPGTNQSKHLSFSAS